MITRYELLIPFYTSFYEKNIHMTRCMCRLKSKTQAIVLPVVLSMYLKQRKYQF